MALAVVMGMFITRVVVPRIRMEKRARQMLNEHLDAEQTSKYLSFKSTFEPGKSQELEQLISLMAEDDWVYLRSREASPFRTIASWGGGLHVDFIRDKRQPQSIPLKPKFELYE